MKAYLDVEHAVRRGVAPFTHPGTVRVRARVEGARLHLEVHDTGTGGAVTDRGGGRGLQITRRRLETVYGRDCDLTLERVADGVSVRLVIPAEVPGVA